jgi:NADH-quinone oxidoreductase subunit C
MSESTTDTAPEGAEATPEPVLLHGCPVEDRLGQTVVFATAATYLGLMRSLADDGYVMIHDLAAVDYLGHPGRALPAGIDPERFEVVVSVQSLEPPSRVRVRVQVPEADPSLPTLFDLWPGTEAMEREAFDLFGISFTGHPDLTRILMPEDWDGHPLRKDAEIGRIPVQFKGAPEAR